MPARLRPTPGRLEPGDRAEDKSCLARHWRGPGQPPLEIPLRPRILALVQRNPAEKDERHRTPMLVAERLELASATLQPLLGPLHFARPKRGEPRHHQDIRRAFEVMFLLELIDDFVSRRQQPHINAHPEAHEFGNEAGPGSGGGRDLGNTQYCFHPLKYLAVLSTYPEKLPERVGQPDHECFLAMRQPPGHG